MDEVVIYFVGIAIFIIFIALYLSKYQVFEGLENASGSGSVKPSPVSTAGTTSVTGVGAPSQLYDQSLTNAISALDTELNMTTYSSQYLQIINNMRELYKRKALKIMLQTPPNAEYNQNVNLLALYGQAFGVLDTLEDFVSSTSKTTRTGLWT